MHKYILITILTWTISTQSFGQNNSYFNDFFDNSQFNTAYNGLNKKIKLTFFGYKNQNLSELPSLFSLSGSYTSKDRVILGARVINKNMGFQNFYLGEANITKGITLSSNDSLYFAVSLGGATNSYNSELLNSHTEPDPVLNEEQKIFFTTGASILYTHKKKYELGVSAPILANGVYGINPLWFFSARGHFDLSKSVIFSPQVILESNKYSTQYDLSGQLRWNQNYWAKFAYNTNNTFTTGLGIKHEYLEIGYAYKMYRDNFASNISGMHNLIVNMIIE